MKAIKIFTLIVLSTFSLVSCKSDDEFYNAVYLATPNLISIDVPASYVTGDYLSFHTDFSRYLPEYGQPNLLDILKTSNATSFAFTYRLEKKENGVWIPLGLAEDEYIFAESVYQPASMTYDFSNSILLSTPGEYRLGFSESRIGRQATDFVSRNPEDKTAVIITTTANNMSPDGYYYFVVTE